MRYVAVQLTGKPKRLKADKALCAASLTKERSKRDNGSVMSGFDLIKFYEALSLLRDLQLEIDVESSLSRKKRWKILTDALEDRKIVLRG
ncbi:hypothetical protein V1478_009848 [Vespula squamosa]|uniref:Uncharacterized protein n=1 Tax=Vespula squamosa TaxID=30214 RepID=A0ABD2AKE0_VESSQ